LSIAVVISITRRWRWFVADITILLALAVFQTIANTSLPPTSDAVPLLGTLFCISCLNTLRDAKEDKSPWGQGRGRHQSIALSTNTQSWCHNLFHPLFSIWSFPNINVRNHSHASDLLKPAVALATTRRILFPVLFSIAMALWIALIFGTVTTVVCAP